VPHALPSRGALPRDPLVPHPVPHPPPRLSSPLRATSRPLARFPAAGRGHLCADTQPLCSQVPHLSPPLQAVHAACRRACAIPPYCRCLLATGQCARAYDCQVDTPQHIPTVMRAHKQVLLVPSVPHTPSLSLSVPRLRSEPPMQGACCRPLSTAISRCYGGFTLVAPLVVSRRDEAPLWRPRRERGAAVPHI